MAETKPIPPAECFPIMAWDWPPNSPAVLEEMKACGLTMAGFVPPEGLDACHQAGLKAIVYDPRVWQYDWKNVDGAVARRNVESLVRQVQGHPALAGYYLRDEPSADMFDGLAAVASELRRLDPQRWAYVNLFPNCASREQLGTETYEEHLERFIAVCRPTRLSYDNYWLMLDDPRQHAFYWRNLEQVRAASQRHGLPFWNIVLSVASILYREASEADLRLQAYSTLAYGARGLCYFTYFAPKIGNYRMAPVDQFGHRTSTWEALRRVNLQVQALSPTMLRLRSTGVYHLGDVPEGCAGPAGESLLSGAGEAPLLVGEFRHDDGATYVMLVNRDLRHSTGLWPQWRKEPAQVQIVSSYTGQLVPFSGEQTWLAPGQGMLLRLE